MLSSEVGWGIGAVDMFLLLLGTMGLGCVSAGKCEERFPRMCGEKHADLKFGCVDEWVNNEGAVVSVPLLADLTRVDLLGMSLIFLTKKGTCKLYDPE